MKHILDYELGSVISETLELENKCLELFNKFTSNKSTEYLKVFYIYDWHCKQLYGQYKRALDMYLLTFKSTGNADKFKALLDIVDGKFKGAYINEKYYKLFVKEINEVFGIGRYLTVLVRHTDRLIKQMSSTDDMSRCVQISLDLNRIEKIVTDISTHCNTYFKTLNNKLEELNNEPDQ